MTSRDLTEWQAYERHAGPVDQSWEREMLAEIHELLQTLIQVTVKAHGGEGWEVRPVNRPWWTPPEPEETEEQYEARLAAEMRAFDAELTRER